MLGYIGDDECSDCAFPFLREAANAGVKAVERNYFNRTGEHKTCGEILRMPYEEQLKKDQKQS